MELDFDFDFDSEGSASTQSFFERLHSDSKPRNLSQIFEEDLLPLRNESLSLRYQPRIKKQQTPPSSSSYRTESSSWDSSAPLVRNPWDIAIARVALVDQGRETGRMGLAVAIRGANEEAKLVLYKQQSHVITILRLIPNGGTVHLRDSYVQFYDDTRHFWSMRFEHEKDEILFVRTMLDNNLPIELHSARSAGDGSVEQQQARVDHGKGGRDDGKKHMEQIDNREQNREHKDHKDHSCDHKEPRNPVAPQPQPKPRLRSLATPMDKHGQNNSEDQKPKPTYMESLRLHFAHIGCGVQQKRNPDRDQIPEEDVIVTPMPRPIGTTTTEKLTIEGPAIPPRQLALASTVEPQSSASLLTKFLDDQGTTGLERKMECILEVMQRMNLPHGKSSPDEGTEHKPKTKTAATTTMTTMSEDSEDKMLDLELAVLNLKKENRALVKKLRKRDEELFEYQSASATLLERLLVKNNELRQRNSILLDTITGKITGSQVGAGKNNNNKEQQSRTSPGSPCANCDRSAEEIEFLKGHISAMDVAMRQPDL